MSTRSTVARPLDNGFEGRYIHKNGSPKWRVVELLQLIRRDGRDEVERTLIVENYGWSSLDPNAKKGDSNYLDERGKIVPGYGLAYSDAKLTAPPFGTPKQPYQQVTADEWCRHDNDPDVEYAYVLNEDRLTVLENQGDGVWKLLGTLAYDAEVTHDTVDAVLAASLGEEIAGSSKVVTAKA